MILQFVKSNWYKQFKLKNIASFNNWRSSKSNGIISRTGIVQHLLLDFTVLCILTMHSYPQFHPRKIWSPFSIMRKAHMAFFLSWLDPLLAHAGMIPHFFHVFCRSSRVPSCIDWTLPNEKTYKRLLPLRKRLNGTFRWLGIEQNMIITVAEIETQRVMWYSQLYLYAGQGGWISLQPKHMQGS